MATTKTTKFNPHARVCDNRARQDPDAQLGLGRDVPAPKHLPSYPEVGDLMGSLANAQVGEHMRLERIRNRLQEMLTGEASPCDVTAEEKPLVNVPLFHAARGLDDQYQRRITLINSIESMLGI